MCFWLQINTVVYDFAIELFVVKVFLLGVVIAINVDAKAILA